MAVFDASLWCKTVPDFLVDGGRWVHHTVKGGERIGLMYHGGKPAAQSARKPAPNGVHCACQYKNVNIIAKNGEKKLTHARFLFKI